MNKILGRHPPALLFEIQMTVGTGEDLLTHAFTGEYLARSGPIK